MKTIDSIHSIHLELHDDEENSHKEYDVFLQKGDTGYAVSFKYGRINGHSTEGVKIEDATEEEAKIVYDKLVLSKMKKGYEEV